MTTHLTATPLPDFAAVRLEVDGALAGPLEVLRTDDNGTHPVRQLPDQETTGGTLALVDYEAAFSGPITYQLLGERTNVLLNPSAEVNASNWSAVRMTLSRVVDVASPDGGAYFRGTVTALGGVLGQYAYPAATAPVTEGQDWSAGVSMRRSTAGKVRAQLSWLTAGGSTVSAVYAEATVAADTWAALTVSGVVPATATQVRLFLFAYEELPVGGFLDYDRAWLVNDATPGAYFADTVESVVTSTVNLPLTTPPTLSVVGDPAWSSPVLAITSYSEASESGARLATIYAGGRLAIVAGLELRAGSVGLHVLTYAEAKALRAMLAPGVVAQLRQATYPGLDLYLVTDRVRVDPAPVDASPAQWTVTLDYTERAWPDTPLESSSAWTWDDLAELCATWDDVAATFPTWFDVAVGP